MWWVVWGEYCLQHELGLLVGAVVWWSRLLLGKFLIDLSACHVGRRSGPANGRVCFDFDLLGQDLDIGQLKGFR